MKKLPVLAPKFMKTLDNYLLLHHHLLWITKAHYVLYYSLLTVLGSTALVWAYPLAPSSSLPSSGLVIFLSVLLVFPAAIFWIYKQTQYNIEKNYGQIFPYMAQMKFGIYLLVFGIFICFPVFFNFLVIDKVANLVDKQTLKDDFYHLNAGNPYFPTHKGDDILWEEDKVIFRDIKSSQPLLPKLADERESFNFAPFFFNHSYGHREMQVAPYNDLNEELVNFRNLFLNTINDEEILTLIANYISTYNKYSRSYIDLSPKQVLENYRTHHVFSETIAQGKRDINQNLYQILQAHRNKLMDKGFAVFLFGLTFFFSSLMLISQSMKRLDFILGVVCFGVGSFIYTFIWVGIGEMAGWNGDNAFTIAPLLGFVFFAFKSLKINQLQFFSRFHLFSLMFANVLSPFVLFLSVAWFAEQFHFPDSQISNNEFIGWLSAGFVLHFAFFVPQFQKLYLKMRDLPKK